MRLVLTSFFIILGFMSQETWGMCDFPHNPPALCLHGETIKISSGANEQSKEYSCEIGFKLKKAYRPASSYWFDKSLNKQQVARPEVFAELKSQVLTLLANDKMCAKLKSGPPARAFLVEWSCYDKRPELKDFSLMVHSELSAKIIDPWAQYQSSVVDCRFLLEL